MLRTFVTPTMVCLLCIYAHTRRSCLYYCACYNAIFHKVTFELYCPRVVKQICALQVVGKSLTIGELCRQVDNSLMYRDRVLVSPTKGPFLRMRFPSACKCMNILCNRWRATQTQINIYEQRKRYTKDNHTYHQGSFREWCDRKTMNTSNDEALMTTWMMININTMWTHNAYPWHLPKDIHGACNQTCRRKRWCVIMLVTTAFLLFM